MVVVGREEEKDAQRLKGTLENTERLAPRPINVREFSCGDESQSAFVASGGMEKSNHPLEQKSK